MRTNGTISFCVAAALGVGVLAAPALAGVVGPGESIRVVGADQEVPDSFGEVIAEQTLTGQLVFTARDGWIFSPGEIGGGENQIVRPFTLNNRVERAADTGRLTFVYDVDYPPIEGIESAELRARGFGGFTTDVYANVDDVMIIRRSADGRQVSAESEATMGLASVGRLIVVTDATAFDAGGELDVGAIELLTEVPLEGDDANQDTFSDLTTLTGVYQPLTSGGAVIPLPPAAWTGLATLAGTGVLGAWRRRRRS